MTSQANVLLPVSNTLAQGIFFFKFCLHLKLITVSICYINYARENMTHIYFQNVADEMRHLTWQDEVLTEG